MKCVSSKTYLINYVITSCAGCDEYAKCRANSEANDITRQIQLEWESVGVPGSHRYMSAAIEIKNVRYSQTELLMLMLLFVRCLCWPLSTQSLTLAHSTHRHFHERRVKALCVCVCVAAIHFTLQKQQNTNICITHVQCNPKNQHC